MGHDQSGIFTITVIPEWINPGDACHVTTPFNYYGENPIGNTTTLTKTWSEHEYLPDLKEANLVMNGSQSCSNSMNGLLNVTGGSYMYLPANEYTQIEFELRNQSLLPANDVTYKFLIKKRNLDPRIIDSEGIIIEFVEWETTDRCYSNPANNQSVLLGDIPAGETRAISLSVSHFRDVLNEMDYKRKWDSDRSEWLIEPIINYKSYNSDGTFITKPVIIDPFKVIFLEDVKDSNYGYPVNRHSIFYGQSGNFSGLQFPSESFYGDIGADRDNKISSSYGACRSK